MTSPLGSSPCQVWDPIWTCDLTGLSLVVTGSAIQAATEVLWNLSGQRFGLCSVTLRPCRSDCQDTLWPAGLNSWAGQTYPQPYWWNGQWLNLTCATCTTGCSCSVVSQFTLPTPVRSITQIKINGSSLPVTAYRLDDNRFVTRVDGGEWPICNDLSKNDTATGTWSVTAQYGEDVPELGKMAVGELACEFLKALTGGDCILPQPIQSIARQGVSITYVDAEKAYGEGHLGLRFTDMFISTYNPNGLRGRSRVYDVDDPGPYRSG